MSLLALAVLQIGVNPDMTRPLQVLATVAVAVGWLVAGSSRTTLHAAWVGVALLAPAFVRLAADREGPVLDVFWMAGLTATLLRTASWSRWSLGGGTNLLAGAWALTLALSWPVLAAREAGFDWRLLFDGGAINSWGLRSAPQVISWMTYVTWTHLLGLLWLDWAAGIARDAPDRLRRVLHGFWIGATASSLIGIYQGVAEMGFLSTPQWAGHARATGTLLDANAFGFCAALAGPSAALALHGGRSARAGAVTVLVLAINLAGLWMSGSRAAMVAGLIGGAAAAVTLWHAAGRPKRRVLLMAGAGALAIASTLVVASGAVGPLRRLFERPAGESGGMISTAFNRPPYGPTAVEIIRDYPLTGVGTGAYQDLAPDYWRRTGGDALPFDHAQNWWRHHAAELGLLGGLPLFVWSALIAWRVLFARSDPARVVPATLVRGLLAAIGVGSLLQVPTQTPVVLLWFLLLLAWLPTVTLEPLGVFGRGGRLLAAVAIVYAAGHAVLARGPLGVAERAKTFGREYIVGAYPAEPMEGGGQFRWTDDESRFIWPARTRWFVIRLWAHHPDIAANPVRVSLTTPCGTLVEHTLTSQAQLTIGVHLPEGQSSLDATVRVSRTWQPSAFGTDDPRRLGVGIAADWVASGDEARATQLMVEPGACQSAL